MEVTDFDVRRMSPVSNAFSGGSVTWIDLPFGWVMPDGEHGIVEESEREALAALAKARLCECDYCTARRGR